MTKKLWKGINEVSPHAGVNRRLYNALVGNLDVLYQPPRVFHRRFLPTSTITVTTTLTKIGDLSAKFSLDYPAHILYNFSGHAQVTSGNPNLQIHVYLDGMSISGGITHRIYIPGVNVDQPVNFAGFIPDVSRGQHVFDLYMMRGGASDITFATDRLIYITWWEFRI